MTTLQEALEKIADALPAYIDGVAAREYLAVVHAALEQQGAPQAQSNQALEKFDELQSAHGIKEVK